MTAPLRLLVVAGEVSGDMHAAGLIEAIRKRRPAIECFGIGGDCLRAAGMEILRDAKEMAAMGLAEVVPKLLFFRRVFHESVALAAERRPDAAILVDYPDFNLRFAIRARELGIKVIYYICPQVWAWRRGRMKTLARNVDRLISIFPFEPAFFEHSGIQADYVGHPLVDEAKRASAEKAEAIPWSGDIRIALLPGSRPHVMNRMLPLFLRTADMLAGQYRNASFMIAAPCDATADLARCALSRCPPALASCRVVAGGTRNILMSASAALVSSGTATVEAALMGCPMVIAYRMSPVSHALARMLVHVDDIGMVNIIAGRRLCPEYVQNAATPAALWKAIAALLDNPSAVAAMKAGFEEVTAKLGPSGSHERAAEMVLQTIG